ncbi:glycosyltransferase family 39 protein [Stenotrophomonas sp. Leaf70]|uniref:ArnT family glycosyltransferase n=1 Tax=Stenotrophomonas sp. Leaf70 TaxID=1736233 RepID=UPI000A96BCAB|nr:glycosyltransferase family 39 protein [Stenotrophomonas sp. Leaf70]
MNQSGWWAFSRMVCGRGGWLVAVAVFWVCILRNVELPGLYMDAINPDYLAARWLNPGLSNPVWLIPGRPLPLLGNLYHGMQTLYAGLLTYGVLGTSVTSVRVAQALFGAFIVLFVWLALRRATTKPAIAAAMAVALATDMAFLGSFRTQAYIILAGQAWMMLGFYLAMRSVRDESPQRWVLPLSGACMGLAVYGYFVFLFFLPPIMALVALGPGSRGGFRRVVHWGAGFVVGMLPYVIGYIELAVAVGGVGPFIEWMRNSLGALKPTEGSVSYLAGLGSAWSNGRMGLAGTGNELMMLNEQVSASLIGWRTGLAGLATVICVLGAWVDWRANPRLARILLASAALPVSYVLCAGWFGSRLWVHHFTVLVAVSYLLLGLATYWLVARLPDRRWLKGIGVAILGVLLTVNVVQQNRVHAGLVATGGVGMSTDALTAMARSALTEKDRAVWFFPDWGFFMPFAFLTGNKVRYENEFTDDALARHAGSGREVRVAFWKREDQERHREVLERNGMKDVRLYSIDRRDGQPGLYVLTGSRTAGAAPVR